MSERITEIQLQAFRGVPETFELDLHGGQSCVVLGDNASGKSSVVDAIEWYFQGAVAVLTKEGRGDAIRHTGAPTSLKTRVSIATDGVLGGVTELKGSAPAAVTAIGRSELPILRGRTLVEFVDRPKAEKYKALAELLGFDDINELRLDLQRAKNDLQRKADAAEEVLSEQTRALSAVVPEPSNESILDGLKERCEEAGIAAPDGIEDALKPAWWKDIAPEGDREQKSASIHALLTEVRSQSVEVLGLEPLDSWNSFVESESVDLLRLELHQAADKLLASGRAEVDRCPLCRQQVLHSKLEAQVGRVLQNLAEAASALDHARREAQRFVSGLRSIREKRLEIVRRARRLGVDLDDPPSGPADEFLKNVSEIAGIGKKAAEKHVEAIRQWDAKTAAALAAEIPEPETERERILIEIGVLHAGAIKWRDANERFAQEKSAFELAERIFTTYQDRQGGYLEQTLKEISKRCAEIYSFLHPNEGVGSVAVERVGEKGAELAVDFFGTREQPVQRVLSESHLSSLGLSLFLAMAETFNESLGFLVLDDVVNSFDRSHRGRLADLLTKEFDNRQLIVLTHDEQFFTRITRLAPSWLKHEFTSWSFEGGPRTVIHDGDRLLNGANAALMASDRIGAAQKGRRALEDFLQEACEELQALLPFRRGSSNDQRMVEEVMSGLRRTLKARAKVLYREIDPLLKSIEADLQAALNVESHASQGGTSNQEIGDALSRIEDLIRMFTCDECGTRVWRFGSPESSRCRCGRATFPTARASI